MPKSWKIIAVAAAHGHVVHELEHHAAQRRGRESAALGGVDLLGDEELDAAFLQDLHGAQHVGRPEADALQVLLRRREPGDVVGLDQLEVERAARAFEQQPLGQDAETLAVRQRREAEDLRVELDPVRGAIGIDVLDESEEVHSAERRRMRVDRRNGAEVDVVDREFVVPVDEVDEALADAVDRGDVELHRPRPHGNLPCAELQGPAERGVGIADADRERADDGALGRLHGARNVRGLRVHDDVHLALAIELDLAGAMARDRPEPHPFEHAAQGLRLGRGELDELDAVDAEQVVRLRDRFAIQ